ncbi:hypothetical protein NUW58_g2813 [Xylaria curta]|uniref:Uncharacterized protein n=1 Tax=Xylaria curta TaxID=42375 RepID=A0ACC1PDT9_9PEZI|nr:hypothetical protein NUW58_g2813 [Xylaria curta]
MKIIVLFGVAQYFAGLATSTPTDFLGHPITLASKDATPRELTSRQTIPDWCVLAVELIPTLQYIPTDWHALVVGTTTASVGTGVTAYSWCNIFTGGTVGKSTCSQLGVAVGAPVALITAAVITFKTPPTSSGVENADVSGQGKRSNRVIESLENNLRGRGVEFDGINILSLLTTPGEDGESHGGFDIEVLGAREASGMMMDHRIIHHTNGTGTTRSTPTQKGLGRRHAGPSIKISYDFVKALSTNNPPSDYYTQNLGYNVGMGWETLMNQVGEYTYDYFGKLQIGDPLSHEGITLIHRRWAVKSKADIISISAAFFKPNNDLELAIRDTIQEDIVVIASTAGEGHLQEGAYPANYPQLPKIAATDNRGRETAESLQSKADFMLPGENIVAKTTFLGSDNPTDEVSGTAVATAIASGIASLVLACHRLSLSKQRNLEPWQKHKKLKSQLVTKAFREMAADNTGKFVKPWQHKLRHLKAHRSC